MTFRIIVNTNVFYPSKHLTLATVRWNPTRMDPAFLTQSASLQMLFSRVQILGHRPFIPLPGKSPSPVSFPALAICTNAARSCCQVAETYHRMKGTCLPMSEVCSYHSSRSVYVLTHTLVYGVLFRCNTSFEHLGWQKVWPERHIKESKRNSQMYGPFETVRGKLSSSWTPMVCFSLL